MNILHICESPTVLSVLRIVNICITVIKVVVPIILIVVGITTYLKSISNEELDKSNKKIVNMFIAAICVFLVPTMINLVINITGSDDGYKACLKNSTSEGIAAAKENLIKQYIENTKNSLTNADYQIAISEINKLKDENLKTKYTNELNNIRNYIDLLDEINSLLMHYDREKYKELTKKVSEITDTSIKTKLEEKLAQIKGGVPLLVDNGTYEKTKGLKYFVNVPENATTNMPLVMFLHGDGGTDYYAKNNPFYKAAKNVYGNEFPFIIVAPFGGSWAETSGRIKVLHSIMEEVCNEYQCDREKLIITGHSRGSIGTWHFIDQYPNYFYAAVPVSCGSYSINAKNFVGTKIKAFAGTVNPEDYYANQMRGNVNKINKAGGKAEMIILNGANHGATPGLAYTKELFEWLLEE